MKKNEKPTYKQGENKTRPLNKRPPVGPVPSSTSAPSVRGMGVVIIVEVEADSNVPIPSETEI